MSRCHSSRGQTMAVMDILPPEPQVRPPRRASQSGRGSVVDANFVTLREPLRHDRRFERGNDNRRPSSTGPSAVWFGSARLRLLVEHAEEALMRLPADAFSAMVALIFVIVFGMAGGFSLVSAHADAVDRGPILDITHVSLTPEDANGMRVLVINGIVENRGRERMEMPAIRADLLPAETIVASTVINPPVNVVLSGKSHGFSARVPHPGGKTPELKLSFVGQGVSRF